VLTRRRKRGARVAAMIDQRMESARTHILAADEAQPVEALVSAELEAHARG
jgi:hypothetical protein